MKKRLLSILMALALCLTLLPTVALADNTTGYTVTFDANGGSGSMTAVTCVSGSYTLPACTFNAPTGKQFKCWSMTPDGSGEKISAGSSITVSGNIVLYAVWGVDPASTFCVSFNANGGRGYMCNIEKDGDYELPACTFSAPADKQFKCWAKGSTEGAQYAIGSIFNVTENVTFYAIWENVYTVAVESDGNGTVSASASAAAGGDKITLTVTPDKGYRLKTLTVTDGSGKEIELKKIGGDEDKYAFEMPASDVTVNASFKANEYVVKLNVNGGTINSGNVTKYTYGVGATLPTDVTKEGYKFEGWYDNEACTGDPVTEISTTATEKKEYWAKWTLNTYTVSFDSLGGSAVDSQTVSHGSTATEPTTAPIRTGHTFGGWYTDTACTTEYDFTAPVTGDLTLYAKWKKNNPPSSTYAITVESAKNGTVTASHKTASKGTTITLTVTPDTGYTLETLTVTDKNGSEIELTDKGDGKYTFKMPASKVTVKATFMEDNSMLNFFVDVPADVYYYDAVRWAAENGITEGVDGTHFAPDATCTRAQAVTFLWRAAGCPESKSSVNPFTDVVEGSYYYDAVLWAAENGITDGVDETHFAPDATCTRAQIVTFLWRATGCPEPESLSSFADVPTGSYYAKAVAWAVEQGITVGTVGGKFSPDAPCTRAQIVTFLYRCLK